MKNKHWYEGIRGTSKEGNIRTEVLYTQGRRGERDTGETRKTKARNAKSDRNKS